ERSALGVRAQYGEHDARFYLRRARLSRRHSAQRYEPALRPLVEYKRAHPELATQLQEQLDCALRHFCGEGDLKWVSLLMWAGGRPVRWSISGKGIHGRPEALHLGDRFGDGGATHSSNRCLSLESVRSRFRTCDKGPISQLLNSMRYRVAVGL